MTRFVCRAALLALASLSPALAADALLRVERRADADLATLRADGVPVVLETSAALFVEGDEALATTLAARGFAVRTIDREPALWDYVQVGLRPDSDVDAVYAAGWVALSEENWVLLRVRRGDHLALLEQALVFTYRLPHEPVDAPVTQPALPGAPRTALGAVNPLVQKIVTAVKPADIDAFWNDVTINAPTGTRYSSSQGCRDAGTYCANKYTAMKLPSEFHNYSASYGPNVIATQVGAFTPSQIYIVIGHLDDLPSSGTAPGADDNASGSVTVLESAKVMSCWSFKSTVRYVNCTGEEQGLVGSDYYAAACKARGDDIRGVMNFDMNGWAGDNLPNPENLDLDYNAASQDLAQAYVDAASTYGTGLVVDAFLCPSLTASDHASFWSRGYKAFCAITDNEGYCGHGGNYPYYHTSNDTIANCGDKSFFYATVKTTVAAMATLAEPFKIAFDRPSVACDGSMQLVVGDRDLNTNAGAVETVQVEVWSTSEPTPELVVLTEDAANSALFRAVLATTTGPAVHGDGLVSAVAGDTVSARYVDALDCDGSAHVPYVATAATDCVVPIISNVGASNISDVAATVTWTTDEASDSAVTWGGTIPPQSSASDPADVTAHQVVLSGLAPCTTYYFDVRSQDIAGNVASSNNGGQYFHFETLGWFDGQLRGCHAGKVTLARGTYACSDVVNATLSDMDLNLSSAAVDTTTVTISSSSETTPETIVLTETGPNTSVFGGSIPVAAIPVQHGDGKVSVAGGDIVTATYHDANDGTGASAVSTASGAIDCAAPAWSGLTVSAITDGQAVVAWSTSEPTTATIEWGTTPALGSTLTDTSLATVHDFTVTGLAECGRAYFRITSTDAYGNTAMDDNHGALYQFNAYKVPGAVFKDDFEAGAANWVLEGEWQVNTPQGKGTAPGDPSAALSGAKVLGHDLTGLGTFPGDYEPTKTERASTVTIDATALSHGQLWFKRWLNTHARSRATIEIWKGAAWVTIWQSDATVGVTESAWTDQRIDISAIADHNAGLKISFKQIGGTGATISRAGWNIDKLYVRDGSLPDYDVCGGCSGVPSFAGLASAADANGCAATGIALAWNAAPGWGSGHAGTYAVYRSTNPAFTPAAANLVADGVAGTNYTDTTAPLGTTLYYVVRAENDETCGGGPNNGGAIDANLVRVAARDDASQPLPAAVTGVNVTTVNDAHVRLGWGTAANAATYHVTRADAVAGPFLRIADIAPTVYEDAGEATTAITRFYLIRGADTCGNEGP